VFSAKTEYGLISLLELASIYLQGGVLQVAEIASRQQMPDRYLEQMLTSLRRAQILRSIRGPRGGYQLAMSPSQIKVVDVVRCLEGEDSLRGETLSETPEYQVLNSLKNELAMARAQILETTTLQDLIDRRDRLMESQAMYFI
jgi:Rrf2 family protein